MSLRDHEQKNVCETLLVRQSRTVCAPSQILASALLTVLLSQFSLLKSSRAGAQSSDISSIVAGVMLSVRARESSEKKTRCVYIQGIDIRTLLAPSYLENNLPRIFYGCFVVLGGYNVDASIHRCLVVTLRCEGNQTDSSRKTYQKKGYAVAGKLTLLIGGIEAIEILVPPRSYSRL